jgi:hypothetical protein
MNEHWLELPVLRGFDGVAKLYPIIATQGYIGGSYAAWMCSPLDSPALPADIDIFATSADNATRIALDLAGTLDAYYDDNGIVYSLSGGAAVKPIQVIRPSPEWKVFPDDIMNSFDLSCSRAMLISPETILGDVDAGMTSAKLLRTHNPLRTLKRIMKYSNRGVEFADSELVKVLLAWESLSAERRAELIQAAQPMPSEPPEDYRNVFDDDEWFEGE